MKKGVLIKGVVVTLMLSLCLGVSINKVLSKACEDKKEINTEIKNSEPNENVDSQYFKNELMNKEKLESRFGNGQTEGEIELPKWVSLSFKALKAGAAYYENNYNLKKAKKTVYDKHAWKIQLDSYKFNNKKSDTGSFVRYDLKNIKTTCIQDKLKLYLHINADKRATGLISDGKSNNMSVYLIKTNKQHGTSSFSEIGVIEGGHGTIPYTITNGQKSTYPYDLSFIFSYNETSTWDLSIGFKDVYYEEGSLLK